MSGLTMRSVGVILMANDQLALLKTFQRFIAEAESGAVIPAVSEHDLRRLHQLCVDRSRQYCGKDGVLSVETMSQACDPEANLPAVWLRHTELRTLYREGFLAEWQHGPRLDDAAFQVAANIPMRGIHLDQQEFLKRLRDRTGIHPLELAG